MEYIHIETGTIREFFTGQPIPIEYVKLNPTKKGAPMEGKHHTEEAKQKIGELNRVKMMGKHWYNNGAESVMAYDCPKGFIKGRLKVK